MDKTYTNLSELYNEVIIYGNFFENNIDFVRNLALSSTYQHYLDVTGSGWRGFRANITSESNPMLFKHMHERLYNLNPQFQGKNIELYFHYSLESTKLECYPSFEEYKLHKDRSNWAGVIYLTPNPPLNSGTSLYSDDKSVVSHIDNIYNRLILYPSNILHGPQDLFGTHINNGRMTLTIFIT
jgi:hypothetical protein